MERNRENHTERSAGGARVSGAMKAAENESRSGGVEGRWAVARMEQGQGNVVCQKEEGEKTSLERKNERD